MIPIPKVALMPLLLLASLPGGPAQTRTKLFFMCEFYPTISEPRLTLAGPERAPGFTRSRAVRQRSIAG